MKRSRSPESKSIIPKWPKKTCYAVETGHPLSLVRSTPSAIVFVPCFELPIPWPKILTNYEMVLLEPQLCYGLELDTMCFRRKYLTGFENWILHCHCGNSKTLQCMAAKVVLNNLVEEILIGTWFNRFHLEYRNYVNQRVSESVLYVGSVIFRQTHLIYIKISHDVDAAKIAQLNLGEAVWCDCDYCSYMVLICRNRCYRSDVMLKCCARRTRRMMGKMLRVCESRKLSLLEPKRQEALRKMFTYKSCLLYVSCKYFR